MVFSKSKVGIRKEKSVHRLTCMVLVVTSILASIAFTALYLRNAATEEEQAIIWLRATPEAALGLQFNRYADFAVFTLEAGGVEPLWITIFRNKAKIAIPTPDQAKAVRLLRESSLRGLVGNVTILGPRDVESVCWTADCSGLVPGTECKRSNGTYYCTFYVTFGVSAEAATRLAMASRNLTEIELGNQTVLERSYDFYIGKRNLFQFWMVEGMKDRLLRELMVSESVNGSSLDEVHAKANARLLELQTILSVGALPEGIRIVPG